MSLAFNALPYLAPLRETVRRILGPQAFSYPVKVLRAVAAEIPAHRPRGRYIHCDYMASGVQDMLTTWIRLAEVPVNYPAAGSTQTIPICALVTALTKCRSSDRSAAVKRTMSMPCYGRAPAVRQPAWYPVRASAE